MAIEFTVLMDDQPGSLAVLTENLNQKAVSIVALHATPCRPKGVIQFVTSNTDATVEALRHAGLDYETCEVLVLTLPGEPGVLMRLARALADAGINVNAFYSTMSGQVVVNAGDRVVAQQIAMSIGIR
ncbi:MAG: ACT domain-containing protein [Anaerolineae bacterium]|nr:ACT domain-containing protein [Anaerolineae bacterium]